MLKCYFNTGHYDVLDSGFCVLKAIVALYQKGIYAGALIKKRRYWPTLVPGPAMDDRFAAKEVGSVEALCGTLNNVEYHMWCMKEPDYVMRIMATGGVLESDETCKTAQRGNGPTKVTFDYTKPFDWHFRYRHAVDDHNNLRHSLPSLEDTWDTRRWEIRVFSFILAITEINICLTVRFFKWTSGDAMTLVQFRRAFSGFLIHTIL